MNNSYKKLERELKEYGAWDNLSVTFRKFSSMPLNEKDAKDNNWIMISDNCKDTSSPFKGRRYILGNEYASILIFDVEGRIVGMQMAFKADVQRYELGKYGGAYQRVKHEDGNSYYYMTAYFTDPSKICQENAVHESDVIGNKLMFLVGEDKYVEGPLKTGGTEGTKWMKGKCMPGMGLHYWYDINKEMDCGDVFPFFLMYHKQKLNGWGFAFRGMVSSPRLEHPPAKYLWYFFKQETLPMCLLKAKARTTQHVYMNKLAMSTRMCV